MRQCELLGLARASYYHQPEPEPDENLRLMRVIDETYLAYPVFGSRQMARWLRRQGHAVNRKRVQAADAADGPGGDLPEAEHVAEAPAATRSTAICCAG